MEVQSSVHLSRSPRPRHTSPSLQVSPQPRALAILGQSHTPTLHVCHTYCVQSPVWGGAQAELTQAQAFTSIHSLWWVGWCFWVPLMCWLLLGSQ